MKFITEIGFPLAPFNTYLRQGTVRRRSAGRPARQFAIGR
jgi:hypothetical protein